MKTAALASCNERTDSWSDIVRARVNSVHCLFAAYAIYHQTCSVNFRIKMQIPISQLTNTDGAKKPRIGQPKEDEINSILGGR